MSRPRSRSPVHPFRSSALKRRSPGRFDGHHYGDRFPMDTMDFEQHRGSSGRDGAWPHGNRRPHEDRHRVGSVEDHRANMWRRDRSPGPARLPRRSPPPGSFSNRPRTPPFAHELGYAERRRLSPGQWPHDPDWRSNSRRRDEFEEDFQRYPENRGPPRVGMPRERPPSPGAHFEGRPGRRLSPPGWDRSDHSNYHREGQEWSPNRGGRGSRGHSPRERTFYHPEQKERCVEEEQFGDFGRLLERSEMQRRPRSPGRARIIVEHDHGIAHQGPASQDCRPYHGHGDQRHLGEGQPRRDQQERPRVGREELRVGPPQGRRSPPQVMRAPNHGRRSPSPRGQKQQESLQSRTQDFLSRLAVDANGDVDLRHVDPGMPSKKKAVTPPRIQGKAAGRWTDKGELTGPLGAARERTQETLTIKVDMGRSARHHSPSQFSSDRQLSLDLISVGRQRLDFLPASEQSGVHGETAVHSGTFAQEIITLVHQVKENFLKGTPLTLNERFSTVQNGQLDEDYDVEEEEDKGGPSSGPRINRRIDMSLSELRAFQKVRHKQKRRAADDPSDLRYDLERRRQERLEEVKVTIPGVGFAGYPQPPVRAQNKTEVSAQDGGLSGPHQSQSGNESASRRWGSKLESESQTRPGFTTPGFGGHRKSLRAPHHVGLHWPQDPSARERK